MLQWEWFVLLRIHLFDALNQDCVYAALLSLQTLIPFSIDVVVAVHFLLHYSALFDEKIRCEPSPFMLVNISVLLASLFTRDNDSAFWVNDVMNKLRFEYIMVNL